MTREPRDQQDRNADTKGPAGDRSPPEFFEPSAPREDAWSDEGGGTVDQQIRINELRERARMAGGGEMVEWTADDCPLDLQEAFWESVLAWESAPDTSFREMLQDNGVALPRAADLDDGDIEQTLHRVVRGLAELHIYLSHTDHLSDRELYEKLCGEMLDQPTKQSPVADAWHCELDVLGGCSKDDLRLLQIYYPEDWCYGDWDEQKLGALPSSTLPPYDRDHWLPKDPDSHER